MQRGMVWNERKCMVEPGVRWVECVTIVTRHLILQKRTRKGEKGGVR